MKKTIFLCSFLLYFSSLFAQYWTSTGNTGLAESNFLGTVDNVPMIFRVNSQQSGYIGTNELSLGYLAMKTPIWGVNAIGSSALRNIEYGGSTIAIGDSALARAISSSESVAIGPYAMANSGLNNINFNVAIGSSALRQNVGMHNIAIGYQASLNTVGGMTTAIGYHALKNNYDQEYKTAFGAKALENNTSGEINAAFGYQAMNQNRTGGHATAVGNYAQWSGQTAWHIVAVGYEALAGNLTESNIAVGTRALMGATKDAEPLYVGYLTGSDNIAIGYEALRFNSSGSFNLALGYQAMHDTQNNQQVTGTRNTIVGAEAAQTNLSGSYNTIVGFGANVGGANKENATAIGYRALVKSNNAVVIGNDSLASIGGRVGWTTFEGDKNYGTAAGDTVPGLDFVNAMTARAYTYNGKEYLGFLASQIQAIAAARGYNYGAIDANGGIAYSELVAILVKALQELNVEITALENQ